jgi:predicted RNase H-like HicB family nuclease
MRYPIAIEPGSDSTAFGVVVPDLPGCFSAGDTLDEALAGAEEAAAAWVDAALDEGEAIPPPSSVDSLRRNSAYEGWIFGVVTLDPALLDDTTERVNITLARRVLRRLDALARAAGQTRSGYIARLTVMATTEDAAEERASFTPAHVLAEVRGLGLRTPSDATAIIRADRDSG